MKWMGIREFLRGGYKDLHETTVVSNQGRPVFTVIPSDQFEVKTTVSAVQAAVETPIDYDYDDADEAP